MGYATIVSGGTDGRYVISLDWGESTKAALLAAIGTLLARLEIITADAQTSVNEAQVLEDAASAKYTEAVETFIAAHQFQQPGSPRADDTAVRFWLQRLRELQTLHEPRRIRLASLKFERAQALKRVAYWTTFQASETRSAWCVDFTEEATIGSTVAVLEIKGESDLIVIAPGARAWTPSDGQMVARELMSPEQVFFNAAILPGWQIDAPTYRWGTVTAVDASAATVDVDLAEALSSAQRLDVNRETSLAAVPANYMETGSAVFEEGDRVVVHFLGQSWASPRVLGFLDNPRPAGLWDVMAYEFQDISGIESVTLPLRTGASANPAFSVVWAEALAGTLDVSFRVNRAGWQTLDRTVFSSDLIIYTISGNTVGTGFDMVAVYLGEENGIEMTLQSNDYMGHVSSDIIEVRSLLAGDVNMNVAFRARPSSTAEVAVVGKLLNFDIPLRPPNTPMVRMAYSLFQNSGT